MADIDICIGAITLTARLRDTATASAVLAALPFSASAHTWGDEVYFETPVTVALEADARDVVAAGELAFWVEGGCIAIGFGPTPLSRGDEIRLAANTNIFADALTDVRELTPVNAGAAVLVRRHPGSS